MAYNHDDIDDFTNSFTKEIGGIAASGNKYLFVAPSRCVIRSIKLVSDTSTASSAAGKLFSFQVANLTQTLDLLSTAKSTATTEITGDAAYDLGADQNLTLSAGDVLELQITKTGSPTDLTSAQVVAMVSYRPSAISGPF